MKPAIKITILFGVITFLCGCSGGLEFDRGVKLSTQEENSKLVAKLYENKIRYLVKGDGTILYSKNDSSTIDEILKKVVIPIPYHDRNYNISPKVFYTMPYLKYVADKLEFDKIDVVIKKIDSRTYILWSEEDHYIASGKAKKYRDEYLNSLFPSNKSLKDGTRKELRAP